ncbi:hypothetical protein MKW94_022356 [Papaver nudicaule]|uniref:ABC transporter domain-containing protein n=1 Tax=Papaver nudicaule TaxID=74823 RepID=A0AA42AV27_PAPNU|nr:hypothetical protein [Papaver nudicaule]
MVLMVSANGAAETLTLAPDFIKGGQAMKSVFDLLDRRTEIEPDELDSTSAPETLRGEVEFKHVDFAYPSRPDSQIFRDLTLRARAGKTLALVGPSGCGKSSVISLVQRFYEPTSGRVLIDGKDMRKYNLKSLRKHIAMAATLANAHKFISALPEGYNTWVGERGIQLSDDGKVVEQGSHSHLLKHYPDGCYANMIQLQRFGNGSQGIVPGSSSSMGGERKV